MTPSFKTKTLVNASAIVLAMIAVVGCSRGIDPVENEPVELVQLSAPQTLVQPVFRADVGSKRGAKTDPLDLQAGYDGQRIVAASRNGEVSAFDIGGQSIWKIDLDENITGGVAFNGAAQTAIVTTHSGKVVALDSETGQVRWQQQLSGTVLTPALIHKDRVVLSANDGVLHGLSLQTGQSVWKFSTQVPNISVRGTAEPALLDDNTVLLSTADGRIHALTVDNGIPQWSRRVGISSGASEIDRMNDVDGAPVVDNNQMFAISYSGQLLAIDLASRQVMYVLEVASLRSVAVMGNQLIATSLDGKVLAFDRNQGTLLWESEALMYRQLTNPVAFGRYVAVGDLEGVVHFFDPSTGNIVSRAQADGALRTLHVAGNRLLTQSSKGEVVIWQGAQ